MLLFDVEGRDGGEVAGGHGGHRGHGGGGAGVDDIGSGAVAPWQDTCGVLEEGEHRVVCWLLLVVVVVVVTVPREEAPDRLWLLLRLRLLRDSALWLGLPVRPREPRVLQEGHEGVVVAAAVVAVAAADIVGAGACRQPLVDQWPRVGIT